MTSDLRFITIGLKRVTDLERIGDLVVNIYERVLELNQKQALQSSHRIVLISEAAEAMVHEALDAFAQRDPERAQQVIARDKVVKDQYSAMARELLTYMMEDARNIYRATRLQSIGKYLERIGTRHPAVPSASGSSSTKSLLLGRTGLEGLSLKGGTALGHRPGASSSRDTLAPHAPRPRPTPHELGTRHHTVPARDRSASVPRPQCHGGRAEGLESTAPAALAKPGAGAVRRWSAQGGR